MDLKRKESVSLVLAIASVGVVFFSNRCYTQEAQIIIALLVCGVLILWATYLFHTTCSPLKSSIAMLGKLLDKGENTSIQYYTNAKSLADGAGEQAVSLEETSASLDEITATVTRNVGNAKQGRRLIEEAQAMVQQANISMRETNRAMIEISMASEEIIEVNKNIEKIAFQTNLLSLNAAVEAARAGEAGAGFAVVADEVHNLAKQSSVAAKDTQKLIRNTLDKIRHGVEIVSRSEEDFNAMMQSFNKSVGLIQEIAEASAEQHIALQQIAESVTQVDKITQKNAAQANDGVDGYEQMESHAAALREVSAIFQQVLNGTNKKRQAMDLVQKGLAMVRKKGLAATIAAADDKNGPFCIDDESYAYMGTTTEDKIILLAHPFVPKDLDLMNLKDIKGKFFYRDIVSLVNSLGFGWDHYWWPKPGEAAPSFKSTYAAKIPGENAFIACGVYI